MVTRFCETEVQISDASNNILFDTLVGKCSRYCPCRCHLTPSVNEFTYCTLKKICKGILKELLCEQRKETYSIFDGGRMKYERIERRESPPINDDKNASYFMRLPSNQRRLSVSSMQRTSKHQSAHQTVKSSNDLKGSSAVDRKTHRAKKIMKATINKGRSEENNEKLIVIPNVRQQVREGDTKLSSEYKTSKAIRRISLKMAKESLYRDTADNDRDGKNKYKKDTVGNDMKKNYENGNNFQRDKGHNDDGRTGNENNDRGHSVKGLFEKGKSLETQKTEKKIRDKTTASAKNVSRVDKVTENLLRLDKVAENKFRNVDKYESFGKSLNNKDRLKTNLSGKDTISLVPVSTNDKRKKNEINDKIQNRRLESSNKTLSGQTAGKPNPRSRGLVIQTQSKLSQVILRGQGQYTKGPHVSKIGQTNHLNKQRDVGEVVDHPPRNFRRPSCVRPKPTVLSRSDAIRPCDYLRALMEDRELCFPKVCAPCPPCRPSTPLIRNLCVDNSSNPCQAHIVQCSC